MRNVVNGRIKEEDLIPKMLTEHWPELVYVSYSNSGHDYGVKPWYGFMYLKAALQQIGNEAHGPAILRLSEGSIFVIDQRYAWKDWITTQEEEDREVIEIPISDPDFDKYKPIIDSRIKDWFKMADKVLCQTKSDL